MATETIIKRSCDRCLKDVPNGESLSDATTQVKIAGFMQSFGKKEYCDKCVELLANSVKKALSEIYQEEII